jgi:hypothetical protein
VRKFFSAASNVITKQNSGFLGQGLFEHMICSMISNICLLGGQTFSLELGLTGSNMGVSVGHTFDEMWDVFCQKSGLMWQLLDLYNLEVLFDALLITFRLFCADIVSGDFCSLVLHLPDCYAE